MGRLTDKIARLNRSESAGLAFSLTVVIFYIFALVFSVFTMEIGENARSQAWYFFLSYLIPSLVIFISVFIFFIVSRFSVSDYISVGFRPVLLIPTLLIFAGAYLSLSEVNEIFVEFLSGLGYVDKTQSLPEYSVLNFILCIVTVGLLPPVLEELLFRGIILGGHEGSFVSAILISALCFSVYHMNPSRTIYQFIMGVLFALVAKKTGSVIPTAIIHSLNNVAVITVQYFFTPLSLSPIVKTVLIALGALCLAAGVFLLFFMTKNNDKKNKNADNGRIGGFFVWASLGLALCVISWIARLF